MTPSVLSEEFTSAFATFWSASLGHRLVRRGRLSLLPLREPDGARGPGHTCRGRGRIGCDSMLIPPGQCYATVDASFVSELFVCSQCKRAPEYGVRWATLASPTSRRAGETNPKETQTSNGRLRHESEPAKAAPLATSIARIRGGGHGVTPQPYPAHPASCMHATWSWQPAMLRPWPRAGPRRWDHVGRTGRAARVAACWSGAHGASTWTRPADSHNPRHPRQARSRHIFLSLGAGRAEAAGQDQDAPPRGGLTPAGLVAG